MKDERTETWNPYQLPDAPARPEWLPDSTPLHQPTIHQPRASWVDPVAGIVRPR